MENRGLLIKAPPDSPYKQYFFLLLRHSLLSSIFASSHLQFQIVNNFFKIFALFSPAQLIIFLFCCSLKMCCSGMLAAFQKHCRSGI